MAVGHVPWAQLDKLETLGNCTGWMSPLKVTERAWKKTNAAWCFRQLQAGTVRQHCVAVCNSSQSHTGRAERWDKGVTNKFLRVRGVEWELYPFQLVVKGICAFQKLPLLFLVTLFNLQQLSLQFTLEIKANKRSDPYWVVSWRTGQSLQLCTKIIRPVFENTPICDINSLTPSLI